MKWEDRPYKGTLASLKAGRFEIAVHHYVGCGEMLFMSCHDAGYSAWPLESISLESAKREAVELVKARISEALEQLESEAG